jgi:hypothetical protein
MKKGLLSILAGALVVVGCQNYDDQFDNLESQISALASTVAGLSQVQSDLSSFTYDGDSEDFESNGLTFSKLKSVSKKLVWKTRDDISFPALGSVGSLEIETGDSELVTSASFPELTKLPYVSTKVGTAAAAANTINLADATSLSLAKITRYDGAATKSQRGVTGTDGTATTATNALVITLDDDDTTTADLTALTTENKDDSDKDVALDLTLNGPRSVTLLNYAKGALIANNATTVTLPDYEWNAGASFDEVVTLAVHKVATDMTLDLANYPDLESLDIRNAVYTVKNPAEIDISINGNTNIETLNVDGYFTSIDATGTSSLENITTAGEVGTFKLTASDVNELTLGHAAWGTAAGYPTSTFEVKDNTKITAITADSLDDITQLSIVNNDKLATISMAALTAPAVKATASATAGTPGRTPAVGILLYGNAKVTATHQKASAAGAITTVAQTVTLDQVPTSVVTWVKAAKAVWGTTGYGAKGTATQTDGTFYIAVDEHTEVAADGDETEKDGLVIANLYGAATSNGGSGTFARRSINIGKVDGRVNMHISTDGTFDHTAASFDVSTINDAGAAQGSLPQTISRFITETSDLMAANGLTITSSTGGNPTATVDFIDGANAGATSLTVGDLVYVTVGGNKLYSNNGSATVTATTAFEIGAAYNGLASFTLTNAASTSIIKRLVSSMTAQLDAGDAYGDASTMHSGSASSTVGANAAKFADNSSTGTTLKLKTLEADNSLDNAAVVITIKRKPTSGDYSAAASWTALDLWKKEVYGVTSTLTVNNEDAYYQINGTDSLADDEMQGTDVILTLTATDAGSLSVIDQPMDATPLALVGHVSMTIVGVASTVFDEIDGNQANAAQTAANLKAAMGLGADAATAATAAEKKAALLIAKQGGFVPSTSTTRFGQDAVTNTAAGAGTTPDLISKLAGI